MSRLTVLSEPPFAAKLATGLVITAVEEVRRLPVNAVTTAVTLPMSALSHALGAAMRLQQGLAEMAIKGDDALDAWFGDRQAVPAWAEFDDLDDDATADADADAEQTRDEPAEVQSPVAHGRFALYSAPPDEAVDIAPDADNESGDTAPGIVSELDYDSLTLAQLRAKLRSVPAEQLRDLADYERSHRARAPFVTMLDNRIASTEAKRASRQ